MRCRYALFSATNASFYLSFGRTVVEFLQAHCRVPCGFASIADVRTRRLDDRMDSYFFAETLKYAVAFCCLRFPSIHPFIHPSLHTQSDMM
jgi:hypothetical protein